MPVADFKTFCRMIENAQAKGHAIPAINVSSMTTANACLKAFAEKKSDGIIQVSIGGGQFASGLSVNDSAEGAAAIAEFVHRMARRYNIYVALQTDHCQPDKVDSFLMPLIRETASRRAKGLPNLFNNHMFDGSTLPLQKNLDTAVSLMRLCAENDLVLEIEAGIVGGEEDGVSHENAPSQRLYTTPEDMMEVYRRMKEVPGGVYMFAATFGNVHGSYKPGVVKLKPEILKQGQEAIRKAFGPDARFRYVFHGGSGSVLEDIHKAIGFGVVKMNVDTDAQYAFTKAVAGHMFENYNGVLKIDGEIGSKKAYDPRAYLKKAEQSMCLRVMQAVDDLKSEGRTIFGS
ncbi:MAG: class II fructose-bisphosphate aldolase [Desulfobacteraceae bacterium]|nr:class II fructose-bisphosphate aldolase [Desulfobacteraceae bacterium]